MPGCMGVTTQRGEFISATGHDCRAPVFLQRHVLSSSILKSSRLHSLGTEDGAPNQPIMAEDLHTATSHWRRVGIHNKSVGTARVSRLGLGCLERRA
ncbi:hypothetical protein O181_022252 [Austropuccinia psidii MF-1]|uniref:Uncharacterized protein n=1 Tax=Austropuccinia psidii MF-1 TaxID=1389203 RepID=A0A9Q3CH48_9BASI|nr:hypothetical protein [Austropuccinia psidii MF-1]